VLIQSANLALRFFLELCALGALGYWGFKTGRGLIVKVGLGIGAPLLAALVWGMLGAPDAPVLLPEPLHLLLELMIFGLAAVALYDAGHPRLAWVFGLAFVINRVLMFVWGQ
jgi:hypothetical protein